MAGPFEIPVGRGVIVADPFGNVLVLVDLSKGKYVADRTGQVTGIAPAQPGDARDNIPARTGTFCCATAPPNPGSAQRASVALPTARSRITNGSGRDLAPKASTECDRGRQRVQDCPDGAVPRGRRKGRLPRLGGVMRRPSG